MSEILLTATNLSQTYAIESKRQLVLDDISLTVKEGEFLCLIGPSGCGKSTLLRLLAGLTTPTGGTINRQENVTGSFVFQNFALMPWLTVEENIGFGLKMAGVEKAKRQHETLRQLRELNLIGLEDKHPKELSGGQKQRVGIARALTMKPKLLFMDEPFSALDALTAKNLRQQLLELWRKNDLTVVMVTHLVEEAVQLADRIVVFSPSPGRVLEVIENKLERPRSLRSQEVYQLVDRIESLIQTE